MVPPTDLLRAPAEESARRIALGLLEEARAALRRLDDAGDAEALHDYRVAIRRLRSTLRAWRAELGKSVPKRLRRALREVQTATGAGRDAEVALAWLEGQRAKLDEDQQPGLDWIADRLAARHDAWREHVREDVRQAFAEVESDLEKRLGTLKLEIPLRGEPELRTFAQAFAEKVRAAAADLGRALEHIGSPDDRERCHEARIAGKRLRYLVEPLRHGLDEAATVVSATKRLQDALGDLNDAHVLREELDSALEIEAVEQARRLRDLARDPDPERLVRDARADGRPGLLAITGRVERRIRKLFEKVDKQWLRGGGARLLDDVEQLALRVESGSGVRGGERRFLLRRLPELPEPVYVVEIDEGFVRGERMLDLVARVREEGEGERYLRRVEIEPVGGGDRVGTAESMERERFEALWPLTAGARVRKRRFRVHDAGHEWSIDQYRDRALLVAAVTVPRHAETPELPRWLAACVEREVTGDGRYTDESLAAHPGRVPNAERRP